MILKDDVIKALNEAGIQILEIFHPINRNETLRFIATQNTVMPQNNINEYTVEGYDITRIIQEDSLAVNQLDARNRITVILTKIQELPSKMVKFSKDFSFIWYIK